jgi:hypothetical protein
MTLPAFDLEEPLQTDWDDSLPGGTANFFEDYQAWLAHGRDLAEKHSGYQWNIGDWLIEGEGQFDPGKIPSYLLIHKKNVSDDGTNQFASTKAPNYWRDAAAEVGMAVPCLREYAFVARAFQKEKRFKQLTFSHHSYAAPYDRRQEYLEACLVEGGKPHSIDWLWKHIRQNEGEAKEIESSTRLRFMVPEDMYAKLRHLGCHYGKSIPDLVQRMCVNVIETYLEVEARKISLEKFDFYDGRWPFDIPVAEPERKHKFAHRRTARKNDPVFSEQMSQVSKDNWARRRANHDDQGLQEVKRLALDGQVTPALTLLRQLKDVTLREAREYVDTIRAEVVAA